MNTSEGLSLRAYVRIVDDETLRPYLADLLPLLDTPGGCLDVIGATDNELISYACQESQGTFQYVRESVLDLGMIHAVVLG